MTVDDNDYKANSEQIKAIKQTKGPLLIIAGAGTGKTFVITEKIQYLITNKLAKPEEILALTFTEKAAQEMEERVDRRIPYGYFQMWISTFHSFADHIIKNEITQIGFPPQLRLMTEAESILFFKKNLFLFNLDYFRPLGNPNKFIKAILQHFSRLKDEDISPEQYLSWVNNFSVSDTKLNNNDTAIVDKAKYTELAQTYKLYQSLKIKEGVCDFSDLVFYCLTLFRKRKNVLKQYQKKFKYVLVDEFQDTNIAQYELIKLLCPPKSNPSLTMVGDDSQAIYKFRGASVSNIMNFMKDYKKAKKITLIKNYRSQQTILDISYRLIKNNDPDTLEYQLGVSKKLIAAGKTIPQDNPVQFYYADSLTDETEYIANQIIELVKNNKRFSDIAILVRANNHADSLIQTFYRYSIPYQFLGPGTLFRQNEIKDLIAYLKILYNLDDSISLYRVLTMDLFDIDSYDLSKILSFSKKVNQSLFHSIEIYLSNISEKTEVNQFENYKQFIPLLKAETKNKLKNIYDMIIKHISLIKKESAGQILFNFLENTGYLLKIINYKTAEQEKISRNISDFFNKLKSYEFYHEDSSAYSVDDYLDMSMELGESPLTEIDNLQTKNAVNILTVHSAKGLEFDIVFLINLSQGRFPTRERKELIPIPEKLIKETLPIGDYHIQEERRLFYVGLTRAKEKVFFTSSKYYGEGKREQKLSPFIIESLGNEFVNKSTIKNIDRKKQLSIFDYQKKPLLKIKEKEKKYNYQSQTVLSYTQLNAYDHCPLQYKYQYIIHIPVSPSAALSFGDTIHKTLQKFYYLSQNNTKYKEEDLIKIYNQLWIPIGYSSQAHELKMKKEGEQILKKYYKKFYSPKTAILALEKKFIVKISPTISIVGKIDRADKLDKDTIEIIDYKTGKPKEEKALKKDFQLSVYALAATDRQLFNFPLNRLKFSYIFLESMEKITITKNEKDIINVKKFIKDTVAKINTKIFNPNVGPWCDFCPFKIICEAWR